MTRKCQQLQLGNMLLLSSVRDKLEGGRKFSSFEFRMKILEFLVLLLLYIIPLPSNQVPYSHYQQQQKHQRQIITQQLRSSAIQEEEVQITPLPLSSLPNGAQQQQQHPGKLQHAN